MNYLTDNTRIIDRVDVPTPADIINENPITDEEVAFNERADRFVKVLRRLRDLEWTIEDYYCLNIIVLEFLKKRSK